MVLKQAEIILFSIIFLYTLFFTQSFLYKGVSVVAEQSVKLPTGLF